MSIHPKLLRTLRQTLRSQADPAKAPLMQAYMKSAMPYLGVQTPDLRSICRAAFKSHPLVSFPCWRDTVLVLWRNARYREERYAAISLAGAPAYKSFRTLRALPMYKEMITTGAWWDYVDSIATRQLGDILRHSPQRMSAILRKWAGGDKRTGRLVPVVRDSDNIWLRRSSILAQLHFKSATDLRLLYDCIRPSLDRPEFFLRKAIGWALRQYARTNPEWVLQYVCDHHAELSPLARREALKHLSQ